MKPGVQLKRRGRTVVVGHVSFPTCLSDGGGFAHMENLVLGRWLLASRKLVLAERWGIKESKLGSKRRVVFNLSRGYSVDYFTFSLRKVSGVDLFYRSIVTVHGFLTFWLHMRRFLKYSWLFTLNDFFFLKNQESKKIIVLIESSVLVQASKPGQIFFLISHKRSKG